MAISLSTSLCTSLATSLCGEDVPVIQANHLNVEYSLSGTVSHLNFLRYPQADIVIPSSIDWVDDESVYNLSFRYPEGDSTKEGQPMYAWWTGAEGATLQFTDTLDVIAGTTHIWDYVDEWVDETAACGWYIDALNPQYTMYAWKCCDTPLIATLYSEKFEDLTVDDTLYKYVDGQFGQSDGVIETRDMSIWSDEFTVLVLDEITEQGEDRIYINVNGASYYNAYQSFVIAPARYGDTIRLYIHDSSTYAPAWSDGSTERTRFISINPSSYGYQISRVYPA